MLDILANVTHFLSCFAFQVYQVPEVMNEGSSAPASGMLAKKDRLETNAAYEQGAVDRDMCLWKHEACGLHSWTLSTRRVPNSDFRRYSLPSPSRYEEHSLLRIHNLSTSTQPLLLIQDGCQVRCSGGCAALLVLNLIPEEEAVGSNSLPSSDAWP